jgi:hypothetical protein
VAPQSTNSPRFTQILASSPPFPVGLPLHSTILHLHQWQKDNSILLVHPEKKWRLRMIFPFPYCVIWGQNNSSRSSDVDQTPLVAILNHVKSPFVVKFTNPPFFTGEIQWNLPGFSNFHRWSQVAAGIWLSATPSPVLPPWPEVKRRLAQRYRNSWWNLVSK